MSSSAAQQTEDSIPNAPGAVLLWTESCTDEKEAAIIPALLAAMIPKLADSGIALLSKTLQERANQYQIAHVANAADLWGTATFSQAPSAHGAAQTATSMSLSLQKSCLLAYSGDAGEWPEDGSVRSFYPADVRKLPYRPAMFLQASIEYQVIGNRGLVFRVNADKLARAKASSRGRSAKDLVATVSFRFPNAIVSGGHTVETVLPPVSKMKVGDMLQVQGTSSEWLSFPTLSGAAGEEYAIATTAQVRVLETDAGKGAMLFTELADVIEKSKTELANVINESATKALGKSQERNSVPGE